MGRRAVGILIAAFLAMSGSAWPQAPGAGALSAVEQKRLSDYVPEAGRILLRALGSENPTVETAAARMLRNAPGPDAYRAVRSLFGDFTVMQTDPGFPLYRDAALDTLFRLDPAATMDALVAAQPGCWNWISPSALFAIVGYDKIGLFANLFYYSQAVEPDTLFDAYILSRMVLSTKEAKYLDLLTFHDYGTDLGVDAFLGLFQDFTAQKLPVDKIIYVMKARAGVLSGHEVLSRTFTREELLFQALLIRLHLGQGVLAPEPPAGDPYLRLEPAAVRQYGLPSPTRDAEANPALYAFLPSVTMNMAVASFYSGAPQPRHLADFQALLPTFPATVQATYADLIARSPDSPLRAACLEFLASRPDPVLRRLALAGYLATSPRGVPAVLISLLDQDADILVRASILELIGRQGRDRITLRLCAFLEPGTDPLLQVVAAGALLEAQGGSR